MRRAACVLATVLAGLLAAAAPVAAATIPATARASTSILAPRPRPTPTATRTPTPPQTPSPVPTTVPTDAPTPVPAGPASSVTPPPCDTRVPQATRSGGFLQVAGVPGDATEGPHAGSIVLSGMSPTSMLPPAVGTVPLANVTLVKSVDGSTPALAHAAADATRFECVQIEMGPSRDYLYATFAFHGARFATDAPGGPQQSVEHLTLTYATVDWEYQLWDGTPVATGSGALGSTPAHRAVQPVAAPSWPPLGPPLILLVALVVVAAAASILRRRRRQGTLPRGRRI